MQFSTAFLAAIAAACQFAVIPALGAAAAADANDSLSLFEDTNFGGTSETYNNPTVCTEVPDKLLDDVSSIIVGAHIQCALYSLPGCVGNPFGTFPGHGTAVGAYPDLTPNNDVAASFLCTHL